VALVLGIFARVANAIRVVGAVYLFATGMRLLWSGLRRARDGSAQVACPTPVAVETRAPMYAAIWQGLVTDLSNPKAAVFFTALLPQFIVGGTAANVFVSTAALGAVAVIAALLGLTAYAMVAARAGTRFGQRRFSTILDIAAGLALAGFGIDLLTRRITQSITPRARIAR
jgi:threonine/homoserine/homoserine lactone efflux protein